MLNTQFNMEYASQITSNYLTHSGCGWGFQGPLEVWGPRAVACFCSVNDPASQGKLPIYTFITGLMCFLVDIFLYYWMYQCITILAGALNWGVFDEQASDSLQLSILESLLRLVCKKPNQQLSGARHRMCNSMSVLQPSTLGRNCTEHKPGYLHAATQWTHTATATPLQLTHMNVMTNVNGMSLYDFYVKFLHFDSLSANSVSVKLTIYSKKNPQNCIFLGGMLKSVEFIIWAHFAANLEWLST